jgi:hypothetical protein
MAEILLRAQANEIGVKLLEMTAGLPLRLDLPSVLNNQ